FHYTSTTDIYILSLHDALPILTVLKKVINNFGNHQYIYLGDSLNVPYGSKPISFLLDNLEKILSFFDSLDVDILISACNTTDSRSEEHTSELQSRENLVCRLLL